jgi:CheY-like chemotaxis protein
VRILVADDDQSNREILARLIAKAGVEVVTVSDGDEALDAIELRGPFDMAFIDLRMPRMGGIEVAETIRRRERDVRESDASAGVAHLPLVALTGADSPSSALRAGFDSMLQKPVGSAVLRGAIERWAKKPCP